MPPEPASTDPQAWDPTSVHSPASVSGPTTGGTPDPPLVPKGGGNSGPEVVNTASLDLFAKNIELLVPMVIAARDRVQAMATVQPGAFFDAYQLRTATSGANGGEGLQGRYYKILYDLAEGLADIANGAKLMSKKYTSTEELNKMKTKELNELFSDASSDFKQLAADSGLTVNQPDTTKTPTTTT
ncbi:hypothetical protein OG599_31690 [Streptomyces sp. NBC_01335]|uniref:hypothetical protein n=1 Tax=Streptomyces sp. NBC_01335 TaxID=2903828 RepID=UPI002E109F7F|nr:hypothetical protein OG599_31690 [Streptomyces sp. NBC_01335]